MIVFPVRRNHRLPTPFTENRSLFTGITPVCRDYWILTEIGNTTYQQVAGVPVSIPCAGIIGFLPGLCCGSIILIIIVSQSRVPGLLDSYGSFFLKFLTSPEMGKEYGAGIIGFLPEVNEVVTAEQNVVSIPCAGIIGFLPGYINMPCPYDQIWKDSVSIPCAGIIGFLLNQIETLAIEKSKAEGLNPVCRDYWILTVQLKRQWPKSPKQSVSIPCAGIIGFLHWQRRGCTRRDWQRSLNPVCRDYWILTRG